MTAIQSVLIAASAGTGKTWQLATRYLALLALNGVDASVGADPARMIAVTFTRKAAGEFRERILSDLAEGARSEGGAARLAARLIASLEGGEGRPGIAPGAAKLVASHLTRAFFLGLLREVVAAYGRLALCTIDSLFARMATNLAYELGFSGFSVMGADEEERERARALAQVYRSWARNPDVYREMERVFVLSLKGEKGFARAEKVMFDLVRQYHELYLDCPHEERWGAPKSLGLKLEDVEPQQGVEELAARARAMLAQLPAAVKIGNGDYGKRYRAFLEAVAAMPEKGHLDCAAADIKKWIVCEAPEKHPDKELHARLQEMLALCLPHEMKRACTRTQSAYRLMRQFDAFYRDYVRSRGKFCFHDVTRLLDRGDLSHFRALLEERMDARYNHWLLDEFQDTSRSQWNVLELFLSEIAQDDSGARSLFVVGDEKQSIYQWRGGDARLFRQLREREPWRSCLVPSALATSFRSAPAVLEMVNAVCDFSATAPDSSSGALAGWDCPEHVASRPELSGCSQIWEAVVDPLRPKGGAVLDCVAVLLEELWPSLQRADLSCAVLLPSHREMERVVGHVRAHAQECGLDLPIEECDAVDAGVDTPLGKGLWHFFHLLLCPGNAAIQSDLAALPFRPLLERPWVYWKSLLDARGYAAVLHAVGEAMAGESTWRGMSPFLRGRWTVWLEEAAAFDEKGGSLEEWLRHMEGLKRRTEPGSGVVQAMTIHQSKGLGFDVVILPVFPSSGPFADDRHMELKREEDGEVVGMLHDDNRLLYECVGPLRELAAQWRGRQEAEGFCKTYVAVTRTARACYVFLPPPPAKRAAESKTSMREIFRSVRSGNCLSSVRMRGLAENTYAVGDPDWYLSLPEAARDQSSEEKQAPSGTLRLPVRWERRSPSRQDAGKKQRGIPEAEAFAATSTRSREEAAAFGSRVHACLASWESLPDAPPPGLDPEVGRELKLLWERPEAARLLCPGSGDCVYCEQSLEAVDTASGIWTSAVIDRLTLHADGTATIVDFKTGTACAREELIKRNALQIKSYRRLVHLACKIPEEKIRVVILATALGETVEIA